MSYNKTVNDSISVNTRIDQPMEHDIHLGCLGEYHVLWVDQSVYSPRHLDFKELIKYVDTIIFASTAKKYWRI
jgi:hypothetical protein